MGRARWVGAALLVAGVTGCGSETAVTRVVNGHDVDGHFIEPEAYAEYMDGVLLEERGDLRGAAAAYERALYEDSDAAEIWARLGRVLCTSARRAADQDFDRAKRKGKDIGAVWEADSDCALERGDVERALRSAERAAALEPDDARATVSVVRALVRARDEGAAERWLRAAKLLYPEATRLPEAPRDVARGGAPPPLGTRPALGPVLARSASSDVLVKRIAAIDAAIAANDGPRARAAAVEAHVDNAWLALRAVELGRPAIARELAELTLAAEPGNADARIAALAAADLTRDEVSFRKWAAATAEVRRAPSADGARVMTELLYRRAGADAARAFDRAWSLTSGSGR